MRLPNAAFLALAPMLAPRLPILDIRMQVKQASQIEVGQPLPAAYVEIVTDGCAADDSCPVLTADEMLGTGKVVLVGMPGAFAPARVYPQRQTLQAAWRQNGCHRDHQRQVHHDRLEEGDEGVHGVGRLAQHGYRSQHALG